MEATITVRDGTGYVSNLPPEAQEPLKLACSFRPEGYQYTAAYKKGRGDGRIKLYKNHKFPAGLLEIVTGVLDAEGVVYTLDIETSYGDKPDLPAYRLVGVEERWYQDAAVEAAILNPRGVIRAPTGSGKTAIGARIVISRGKWALIVVPTIDLLYQYKRFLENHVNEIVGGEIGECTATIGQLGDGTVDPQPITVATVRTAARALGLAYERGYEFVVEADDKDDTAVDPRKLREWIEKIGTLIVDEAHILGAQVTYDLATGIPCPNKYGMSASPWRDDGADLQITAATGPVIYEIPTKVLVDEGFLIPPVIEVVDTAGWWMPAAWGQTCSKCKHQRPMTAKGPATRCPTCGSSNWRSEFGDAYKFEIVENPLRNAKIAERVNKLDGASLVLVKQVNHGKLLEDLIDGALFLSGKDAGKRRNQVYDDMREGRLRTIIATTIADMGLDLPILRNLVLAGGGKSSTRHLQRIGRVARPYPGKDFARVIDFDDSHVHKWFREHTKQRRKIEHAEWGDSAIWL